MKVKLLTLLLFISVSSFGQGEANNWYFGFGAGIKFFADGSVAPLSGGQMNTNEGCSTISDADGNLLFYTDGRSVWDRNHVLMPNANYNAGTGLFGDPSSTQSGIIVPKKGDPNIYYIFTVDEPHHDNASVYPNQFDGFYSDPNGGSVPADDDGFNNGLNYSIVDLSVTGANGSIGNVTTRNVHLLTYNPTVLDEIKYKCAEKITAVKNADGSGYWVIAHFIDKFYAFAVDENGVDTTPIVTQIAPVVPVMGYRRNAIGCIKASPDGTKLAIAHQQFNAPTGGAAIDGAFYLYDFNAATGVVSNPLQIASDINAYGIEFSPQGTKLYTSYSVTTPFEIVGSVNQYDLTSSNIPGSTVVLATNLSSASTLQLGPNGKIYRSNNGSQFLDVINNPEEPGFLCGYTQNGQFVQGTAVFGLPPFITSFFSASIDADNKCAGDVTEFQLHVNAEFDSVIWDFGDGSPTSSEEEPSHTFPGAGNYTVIATITRDDETTVISSEVRIAAVPLANQGSTLVGCDPDNDGVTTFRLNDNTSVILGTQNTSEFDVKYYLTEDNAANNTGTLNGESFINTSNPQTIWARISNKTNTACHSITSFEITVSNTPVMLGDFFAICDDAADGSDTNGKAAFDLTEVTEALVQNTNAFTTTYFASEADAQNDLNPLNVNFNNTQASEQVVYAKIVNNTAPSCVGIEPIRLIVNPLPAIVNNAILVQCDTGITSDGITQFNLNQANALMTVGNGDDNVAVEYFLDAAASQNDTPLPFDYTNIANPQVITAKVTNTTTGCVRLLDLTLQVNTNNTAPIELERCDDDGTEDGLALFNLTDAGLEGTAASVIYYANAIDALLEQNAITASYANEIANRQSVYARTENNNDCISLQEIVLIVRPLPVIDTEDEQRVCQNTGAWIMLDSGLEGSAEGYAFQWSTGATTRTIWVNQPGIYTVSVINNNNISACSRVRTVTVIPSNIAIIDDIQIVDLADNNTVTVHVHPANNVNTTYEYSLDMPEGPFQESNYFEHVTPGIHTVYVNDVNGCGVVSEEISVLQIPKFFTPNGDGINDYWRIVGMDTEFYSHAQVNIFDRFGKLLSVVDPKSNGWDGTYNGYRMPSTDYWYLVVLENGRTVRGHFSMIR